MAAGLAATLATRGVTVVSGGARGIDTAAHRGALETGGPTVAVLGSGLARPYPAENKRLFNKIADGGGAVISELPVDYAARPENFPRRNRLISGLSAGVVVVEAAERSGSLITAGFALEQNREVLAVPGPVHSEVSVGCHRLIQTGAKLVQNSDDILDELSPLYRGALRPRGLATAGQPPETAQKPTDDQRTVLSVLDVIEPRHIDEIADRTPLGTARLQAALFGLVLRGSVEELTGRYYVLRPPRDA